MAHQLQVMAQQLDMLRGYQVAAPTMASTVTAIPQHAPLGETPAAPTANPVVNQISTAPIPAQAKPDPAQSGAQAFWPLQAN
ncbi:MAG: hypothetical protein R2911_32010 [Caldilineaceae bacterium]